MAQSHRPGSSHDAYPSIRPASSSSQQSFTDGPSSNMNSSVSASGDKSFSATGLTSRSAAIHADDRASPSSSRSQSSSYPHCSFCLVAEFDIDKGSTLSYQYPAPSGHDEHMLAELMLPDGVHARSEDWTVFFLPEKQKSRDNLYYVLNLVRTKHDNTVRRGALVKAIAIATRHPFIHVFKPALLLALDEYYRAPGMDVLMRLFDALNSLDLSPMPRFTRNEKLLLRANDRRDLFEERFTLTSRSLTNLRPLAGSNFTGSASAAAGSVLDDDDPRNIDTFDTSQTGTTQMHSRSGSGSSMQSSEDVTSRHMLAGAVPSSSTTGRRTPHLPHRPSLASLRLGNGSGILKRKPSAAAQTTDAQQQALGASCGRTISSSLPNQSINKVKDTHIWETSVAYSKIQELPIRIPTDVFDEEVGEYSLIHLINTFGASHPIGPQHPHLHSNGHLTSPIILLFNAVVTGKRIIFLGHNQPAHQVAGHVLSLCALANGCGTSFRGVVGRCFPYANLASIEEFENIPGYIAGVTNPRFEELRIWDVLCNIETGRITVSKDIEPAAPLRPGGGQPLQSDTYSSIGGSAGIGSEFGAEGRLTRAPSEPDVSLASNTSSISANKGRDRSGTTSHHNIEARHDAPDNAFMDEIMLTIAGRYSERYLRARFAEYVANFIRLAARHEEYCYGQTSLAPSNQPCLNGQLGSGSVYPDREAEVKDLQVNAHRIEGWRATGLYTQFLADEPNAERRRTSSVDFDMEHQIGRLRRGKRMQVNEAELIFSALARQVRSQEQIVEMLSHLPAHHGGLLPLSNGLMHTSSTVRQTALEVLVRVASHVVGRKFMQNLNIFHRLAFARALHDSTAFQQQQQQQYVQQQQQQLVHSVDSGQAASASEYEGGKDYVGSGSAKLAAPQHLTSTPMSLGGSYQSAGSQNAALAGAAAARLHYAAHNEAPPDSGFAGGSGGAYAYSLSATPLDSRLLSSSSRSASPAV